MPVTRPIRGSRPSDRYALPSLVSPRAGRNINVPAFVALRVSLRRFRNRQVLYVQQMH
jgi:hypothetical protein